MSVGILNGLYVSSYVFLGHMPNNLTCVIPSLNDAYWSHDEIKNISTRLNDKDFFFSNDKSLIFSF